MAIPRQQIIKLLIERGVFDSIEVEEAISLQKKEGQKFSSLLIKHAPEKKDIAIEFHSLSKTFNMTGWRIGFACGNHELIEGLAGHADRNHAGNIGNAGRIQT